MLFCICVVLLELEWAYIANKLRALSDSWFARGAVYSYVGLASWDDNGGRDGASAFAFLSVINIASLAFVCVGGAYALLGLLCLKPLKEAGELLDDHAERPPDGRHR